MRISVVIPVYNGVATIDACLRSLEASGFPDVEIIVVDDGSTDGTADVAASHDCRLIRSPQNVGAARAKNMGAEQATGEVLFFTDADVLVPRQGLVYVFDDLQDPSVTGVVGLLGRECPYPNFGSQFKNLWMHFTYLRQPRRVGLFYTSAAAIRRETFLREGGFDANYHGASVTEDIELGQRLLEHGCTVIMDKRLAVIHMKQYDVAELLRTDMQRARGLVQTWLRNRARRSGAHYASVPWYFGASVGAMGMLWVTALLAVALRAPVLAGGCATLLMLAWGLNTPFLGALAAWRGFGFLLQSMLFLPLDLSASGLGIVLGLWDFARGKRF